MRALALNQQATNNAVTYGGRWMGVTCGADQDNA